jgi:hypothetical protein
MQCKVKSEKLKRGLGHGKLRHCVDKVRLAFQIASSSCYLEENLTRMGLKGDQVGNYHRTLSKS